MGSVEEAVEDCVRHGGLAERFMPQRDGKLACHDGRPQLGAIFDDLKQFARLL